MNTLNYYLESETLEVALNKLSRDFKIQIENIIRNADEYDVFDVLKGYDSDCIYDMDDLDDEFYDYTVTEVLEELSDIDTYDKYFNKDRRRSGDNVFEVSDVDSYTLACYVADEELDGIWIFEDAFYEMRELKNKIIIKFNKVKLARELFEKRLAEDDVDELINTLWN